MDAFPHITPGPLASGIAVRSALSDSCLSYYFPDPLDCGLRDSRACVELLMGVCSVPAYLLNGFVK